MENPAKSSSAPVTRSPSARTRKKQLPPWTFGGVEFTQDMVGDLSGFVYLIECPNGKKYIGKKFFWSMRKAPGAKRRKRQVSDWERYFSSSDVIKEMLKEHDPMTFKRTILSLHELERDVSYCEVREQWKRDVLEERDSLTGERVYLNDNISGKFYPGLYADWRERSKVAPDSVASGVELMVANG